MAKRKNDVIRSDENPPNCPAWFKNINSKVGGLNYYPHCKMGEGFVPHVISSESGCIMVYPVDEDVDSDEAAFNLEKANDMLAHDEPNAEIVMAILLSTGVVIDKAFYEKRNIRSFGEHQLIKFAKNFFSKPNEQVRCGKAYFRLGVYDSAFDLLINAEECDDADAQYMIGQMYAKGKGVAKDKKKAEEWYWKGRHTRGMPVPHVNLKKALTGKPPD